MPLHCKALVLHYIKCKIPFRRKIKKVVYLEVQPIKITDQLKTELVGMLLQK